MLRIPPVYTNADRSPGAVGTTRLEAFSDAVFSIAATLLVIEIAVPHSERGQLGLDLLTQWPAYASYIVSFLTIGIMWLQHHFLIGLVSRVDRPLVLINLALLGTVAFIPFPTAVIGDYLTEGDPSNLAAAAVLYGITMLALTASFTALWLHVRRTPAIAKDVAAVRGTSARALFFCTIAAVMYLVALALAAFVSAYPAIAIYLVVAALFAIGRLAR